MFTDLKARALAARKAKDKRSLTLLSTLIGNLQANAKMVDGEKVITDSMVVSMIRYNLKGLNEMLSYGPNEQAEFERSILESLLPQQMSVAEIKVAVAQIIMDGADTMGAVMNQLKSRHDGKYDGKTASQVVRSTLDSGE